MWVAIYICICIYMHIYIYIYIYLDIYVGRFWKFHSNVICIELMACNKVGVDRNEYKLHCTFSPSTLWFVTCITDIGAHKPWLLAPFAMQDFPMYYIPNVTKNIPYMYFVMLYLYVLHGDKTYSLKLIHYSCLGPLLLTWFNFDPSMDK